MVESDKKTFSDPDQTAMDFSGERIDIRNALDTFKGSSHIFPLKNVVLFPKTGQSFRIFETRYKEMVDDALRNDRFLTIALLKRGKTFSQQDPRPGFYSTGTLAYILSRQIQKNGDYRVSVIGLKKVRINEYVQTRTYRTGSVQILEDVIHFPRENEERERLLKKFSRLLNVSKDENRLRVLKHHLIDVEMVTNIVCSVYPVQKVEQQKLLELPEVGLRLDVLCHFMDSEMTLHQTEADILTEIPYPIEWN